MSPRRQLDHDSGDTFATRVYLLKREMDLALLDPKSFSLRMAQTHKLSEKAPKFQIRVSGPIEKVLELVNKLRQMVDANIRILKLARDKKQRNKDFVGDSIRVYINVK